MQFCCICAYLSSLLTWYTILKSGRELRFVFLSVWMTLFFSPACTLSFLIIRSFLPSAKRAATVKYRESTIFTMLLAGPYLRVIHYHFRHLARIHTRVSNFSIFFFFFHSRVSQKFNRREIPRAFKCIIQQSSARTDRLGYTTARTCKMNERHVLCAIGVQSGFMYVGREVFDEIVASMRRTATATLPMISCGRTFDLSRCNRLAQSDSIQFAFDPRISRN